MVRFALLLLAPSCIPRVANPTSGTLAADLKKATDEVKVVAEKANTESKRLGDVTGETKEAADKAHSEMAGITARVNGLEQKSARRGNKGEADEVKSWGQT